MDIVLLSWAPFSFVRLVWSLTKLLFRKNILYTYKLWLCYCFVWVFFVSNVSKCYGQKTNEKMPNALTVGSTGSGPGTYRYKSAFTHPVQVFDDRTLGIDGLRTGDGWRQVRGQFRWSSGCTSVARVPFIYTSNEVRGYGPRRAATADGGGRGKEAADPLPTDHPVPPRSLSSARRSRSIDVRQQPPPPPPRSIRVV